MTDEEQLKSLEHEWMSAWQRQDRTALEAILAPDYEFVLSATPTRPYTRAEWLARALSGYSCSSFTFHSIGVRVLEPYAVVTSRYSQVASVDGADRSHEFFLVDVWRRTAHRWEVVARHSAWPEPESAAASRLIVS